MSKRYFSPGFNSNWWRTNYLVRLYYYDVILITSFRKPSRAGGEFGTADRHEPIPKWRPAGGCSRLKLCLLSHALDFLGLWVCSFVCLFVCLFVCSRQELVLFPTYGFNGPVLLSRTASLLTKGREGSEISWLIHRLLYERSPPPFPAFVADRERLKSFARTIFSRSISLGALLPCSQEWQSIRQ